MYNVALALHLLAATIWTGGHIILACSILPYAIKNKDLPFLKQFESCYEKVGMPALLIQVMTGMYLAKIMLPKGSVLFDFADPMSKLISIKLILLAITAVLALDARLRIIPKLSPSTVTALAWHIVPVSIVSVLFAVVGVSFRTGWFY
ncbi:MAG: copper resistance protein CopD [Parashewanella sp.]